MKKLSRFSPFPSSHYFFYAAMPALLFVGIFCITSACSSAKNKAPVAYDSAVSTPEDTDRSITLSVSDNSQKVRSGGLPAGILREDEKGEQEWGSCVQCVKFAAFAEQGLIGQNRQ